MTRRSPRPRPGLDRELIVEAAVRVVDREGWDALGLRAIADELGVQSPSLYNHVEGGLPAVRAALSVWATRDLTARCARACAGRASDDAVRAIAHAYRALAHEHPGLLPALAAALDPGDPEAAAAGDELLGILFAALDGYGLRKSDAVHAARALRAAVHGFVLLEASHGFGLPHAIDESFRRLVETVIAGLHAARPQERP